MEKIILQFKDLDTLWAFTRTGKVQDFKVNTDKKQLICTYHEQIVTEALVFFGAKMLEEKPKK